MQKKKNPSGRALYFLMPGAILFPSVMLATKKLIKDVKYGNQICIFEVVCVPCFLIYLLFLEQ